MSGHNVAAGRLLGITTDPGWRLVGLADSKNDGYPALLIQNAAAGRIDNFTMVGMRQHSGGMLQNPGADWRVATLADYNGNGQADVILQHKATTRIGIWRMSGYGIAQSLEVVNIPGAAWAVGTVR